MYKQWKKYLFFKAAAFRYINRLYVNIYEYLRKYIFTKQRLVFY